MKKVTPANEDYLEAIYELSALGTKPCRSVDIASKLDVSKASVNKAVSTLKEAGLVDQPFYGDVTLTEDGRVYGREVLSRHRALYMFLHEMLGVDEETAETEACAMEHVVSDETMRRWIDYVIRKGR